jgi:hypothetical protein
MNFLIQNNNFFMNFLIQNHLIIMEGGEKWMRSSIICTLHQILLGS